MVAKKNPLKYPGLNLTNDRSKLPDEPTKLSIKKQIPTQGKTSHVHGLSILPKAVYIFIVILIKIPTHF